MNRSKCNICYEFFDLDQHLPIIVPCGAEIICKLCLNRSLNDSKTYTCTIHQFVHNEDIDMYKECKETISLLQETYISCYYDNNQATYFNTEQYKALCQNHSKEIQECTEMRDLIIFSLIKVFKSHKTKLSYEFKRLFSIILSQKYLEPKLNYLYALLSYISNEPEYENQDPSLNDCIDPKTFVIKLRNLNNYQDKSSVLRIIFDNNIQEILKTNIWYFNGVVKYFFLRNNYTHRVLIEIELMKRNYIKRMNDLSCVYCNKGFQLGFRYPFCNPGCSHFICYACAKTQRSCGMCLDPLNNITLYNDDAELYKSPSCSECNKLNPISFNNLPYRSYCDCVYCETCIKYYAMNNCRRCLNIFGSNKEFQFKVCKKSLLAYQYMVTDATCSQCNNEAGTKFSKKYFIVLCNTCFANSENKADLCCKRLDLSQEIDKTLISIYKNSNQTNQNIFDCSNLNRKLFMLSKANNLDFNYFEAEYNLYNLKIFKRFKVIYPVNSRDKRGLKINKNYTYSVEVFTNKNIRIFGAIIGGNPEFHGAKVNAKLNICGSEVSKEFNGKQGYLIGINSPYRNSFKIIIEYTFSGVISTGKYSISPTYTYDQTTFRFSPEQPSRQGPLLGLIYSDDE